MRPNSIEQLLTEMESAVSSMETERAIQLGFGAVVPHPAREASQRANARTQLLAERVLDEVPKRQPIVVLKGLEVAHLYPIPAMRPLRDVDVLVEDTSALWEELRRQGFQSRPTRRADIDHHHLPALKAPYGAIGIEVHSRPNTPGWGWLDPKLVLATSRPSRTGIDGVARPRDDLHALILAFHAWKSGFTRPRDLYDALLLARASDVDVEVTARNLGLERMWRWTMRFARELFTSDGESGDRLARILLPSRQGIRDRRRVRVIAPFVAADPVRVMRGHLSEYRLGRSARRPSSHDGTATHTFVDEVVHE